MPRQTKEQIDAEIVDAAAALFARYGYEHTSLQRIADAVGYSKTGLLNRLSSKEAIFQSTLRTTLDVMSALVGAVSKVPEGPERDEALFEGLLDLTWRHPGASALMQSLAARDPQNLPREMQEVGAALARSIGISAEHSSDARLARIIVAATGAQESAMAAARLGRQAEWRPHIMAATMAALGHEREVQE